MSVSGMVSQSMLVVFEKNGDPDISRVGVVETCEQVKMQRNNKVYLMDLILDGGKTSAGLSSEGTKLV